MHLALIGLFRAKWSADVHEEWISSLLKKRPDLTRDKLERTRILMDQYAVDALVTGYEDLISARIGTSRSRRNPWHSQSSLARCRRESRVHTTRTTRHPPGAVSVAAQIIRHRARHGRGFRGRNLAVRPRSPWASGPA